MSRRIQTIVLEGVLAVLGITTVFPFVWMLFSAFKPNREIVSLHQSLLPQEWTLENFTGLQDKFDFLRFFLNSLGVALVITAVTIYTSCLCGYVLAKYRFRGRNAVFGFILGTMMIPWAVTIIPRYSMFASWGLRDHYIALILPAALSGFGIFMFRQSMSDIPDAILEAARIDGAGEIYIFHRIVLPMSRNPISALAIFQFLWSWEDYLWPYLMMDSEDKQVLAVGLTTFNGRYGTDYGGLFAATTISVIPVLVVYLLFQTRFIAGAPAAGVGASHRVKRLPCVTNLGLLLPRGGRLPGSGILPGDELLVDPLVQRIGRLGTRNLLGDDDDVGFPRRRLPRRRRQGRHLWIY